MSDTTYIHSGRSAEHLAYDADRWRADHGHESNTATAASDMAYFLDLKRCPDCDSTLERTFEDVRGGALSLCLLKICNACSVYYAIQVNAAPWSEFCPRDGDVSTAYEPHPEHVGPELRGYQVEAADAVEKAHTDGQRLILVALPTGTGKTVFFAESIRRRGPRALVVAHREELLDQATTKLIAAGIPWPEIGRVKADADEYDKPVVVASVQTLARASRRARLGRDWQTIVVDEAHHAPADSYVAVLEDLAGPDTLTLGVTATPNRKGMEAWGEPVYSRTITEMIAEGWLADLRGKRIALDMSFKTMRKTAGDWRTDDLAQAMLLAEAPKVVADQWLEHTPERPTLAFTPTVELAYRIAEELRGRGVAAEAIDGTTDTETRAAVLDRFRSGETRFLANCALLTEGVDLPMCSCVVVARPTLSPLLYAQMIGRGLRTHPGKTDCLVLDLAGASARHNLTKLRKGEGPQPVGIEDITGVAVEEGASLAAAAAKQEQLRALLAEIERVVMVDVDLLDPGSSVKAQRWIALEPTISLLAGFDRSIVVEPQGARWAVRLLGRGGENTQTVLRDGRDDAHRYGELWLDQVGSANRGERWRAKAPTSSSLGYLRSVRPDVPQEVAASQLSAGQISDLIAAGLARRKLHRLRLVGR